MHNVISTNYQILPVQSDCIYRSFEKANKNEKENAKLNNNNIYVQM